MSRTDQIYAHKLPEIPVFSFNDAVAEVFTDMINRSVPGYQSVLALLGSLSSSCVTRNSNVYDLGCSLGAASIMIQHHVAVEPVQIIAIDNSSAMIEKAKAELPDSVSLKCEDVLQSDIENASLACLNLTLQFIAPGDRKNLLENIYHGLNPGGALLIFEKICFADESINQLMIDLYHQYKKTNGYTSMEISQKRTALENTLLPDTPAQHEQRLAEIGFTPVTRVFQALNFMAWIAWKPLDV